MRGGTLQACEHTVRLALAAFVPVILKPRGFTWEMALIVAVLVLPALGLLIWYWRSPR